MSDLFKAPLEIQIRSGVVLRKCVDCNKQSTHLMVEEGHPTWVCCSCRFEHDWSKHFDVCRPGDSCLFPTLHTATKTE